MYHYPGWEKNEKKKRRGKGRQKEEGMIKKKEIGGGREWCLSKIQSSP